MNVRDDSPPSSSALEFWREAVAKDRLRDFKPEALVAALQDLGPTAERRVREALAFRISDALMRLLRKRVGLNHPNQGRDIIDRVHTELLTALFEPSSADGKAMRTAFSARVSFRIKDAIATEYRHSRIPTNYVERSGKADVNVESAAEGLASDAKGDSTGPGIDSRADVVAELDGSNESIRDDCQSERADALDSDDDGYWSEGIRDPSLMDGVRDIDELIDVKRLLSTITNEKKRLAFYLHMDRIPIHSTKGPSIAEALGVDRKTVGNWISEVQEQLSQHKEVKLLDSASSGGRQ